MQTLTHEDAVRTSPTKWGYYPEDRVEECFKSFREWIREQEQNRKRPSIQTVKKEFAKRFNINQPLEDWHDRKRGLSQ